jgi:D-alanine-D-alanine ligase
VYDYECKYTAGMAEERVADLAPGQEAEVQRQARLAFDALGLGGYARVDFRWTRRAPSFVWRRTRCPG